MSKKHYGFSTTIPYGTDLFEVTGTEFCEWEDVLEKAGNDKIAAEWGTYDLLIGNGYFVSQPTTPRPDPNAGKPVLPPPVYPDFLNPGNRYNGFNRISGDTREPVWTQSRILSERDKLLKEREKMVSVKEAALHRKISQVQGGKLYHEDGTPFTKSDHSGVVLAVLILIAVILFCKFC